MQQLPERSEAARVVGGRETVAPGGLERGCQGSWAAGRWQSRQRSASQSEAVVLDSGWAATEWVGEQQ